MHRRFWIRPGVGILTGMFVLIGLSPVAQASEFVREDASDFDCDGIRDLVNFSPDIVDGVSGAGSITVTYSGGGEDYLTQATPGVPGGPEKNDLFGWRYTTYDRDGDGCDELVVGIPWEDIGERENAGMVTIIPGSPSGLDPSRSVGYTQNSPGFPGGAEALDWFGLALSAGTTHLGDPFLLIGAPGESGKDQWTRASGSVYYLRDGAVTVFHQDTPGVSGRREVEDRFGQTLASSDRYFVVGSPMETIDVQLDGMVRVFSHSLVNGRPTEVAAFSQDTPGISGKAERGDRFGWSVSVLPFRPSTGAPIGALVAVGSPEEAVGDIERAGMAHLVYVSPGGGRSQLAAVTQRTTGVSGGPEAGDRMGDSVVLANLDPTSAAATPLTLAWAVAVTSEEVGPAHGAVHVFPPGWRSGEPDIWLKDGEFGLQDGEFRDTYMQGLRASSDYLHVGGGGLDGPCYAVPWRNLLGDSWRPVVVRDETCEPRPGLS